MKSPLQLCSFSVTHRPVAGCGCAGKFSGEKRVLAWQCGGLSFQLPSQCTLSLSQTTARSPLCFFNVACK